MAGWRDRVELRIEVGLRGDQVGEFQWDISEWDSDTAWSGVEPTFVQLDRCTVEYLAVQRGRDSGAERHLTGTGQLELAWSTPASGAWSFRPTAPVRLGQEMRVRARVDGGAFIPVFRGAVRRVRDRFTPAGPFRLEISLVDRLAELAAVDLPAASPAGAGETTSERLLRILGEAGIPDHFARLDAGQVTHADTILDENLLDLAARTVEGESGDLYVDREGMIVFRERGWFHTAERAANVLVVWTNTEGVDPLELCPVAFGTVQTLDDVVNLVVMGRDGAEPIVVQDASSMKRFGVRSYKRTDLTVQLDADVSAAAAYRLAQQRERTRRLDAVSATLDPYAPAAAIKRQVDVEIGDRHRVEWTDGAGDPFDGLFHVQGVQVTVTPSTWKTTVNLWNYEGVDADAGRWSEAHWNEANWS